MAASKPLLAFLLLLSLLAAASSSASAISDGDIPLPLTLLPAAGGCRGSVGECLAGGGDDEMGLGHHHGRALYDGGGYLSYRALRRDSVPCSRRGDSYYNCRPAVAANPYSRGCSRITRCRG